MSWKDLRLIGVKRIQVVIVKIQLQIWDKVIGDPVFILARRNKRQRLSFLEKSFIFKEIKQSNLSINDITQKYRIWRSTVFSIINDFKYPASNMFSQPGKISRIILSSRFLNKQDKEYWDMQTYPFISQDVANYMKERFGMKIGNNVYSKMMKENLLMSYKKGKSCISDLQKNRMELLKCWFAVHIIPNLSEFDMVININESSLSRATKLTHSWLTKGKACKLNNIWYSSSTSLIAAITSRGDAFAANTAGSVNGQMFLEFIVKLWKFIEKTCKIQAHKCQFMFESAMTHRSSRVVDYWKQRNLSITFIPPYMPELALIEKYLSILMRSVLRKAIGKKMSWQSVRATNMLK